MPGIVFKESLSLSELREMAESKLGRSYEYRMNTKRNRLEIIQDSIRGCFVSLKGEMAKQSVYLLFCSIYG